MLRSLLFLVVSMLIVDICQAQSIYNCQACGTVEVLSTSKTTSGPGCLVSVAIKIETNNIDCVNNSWNWTISPSSGNIYVGYTPTVPYTYSTSIGPVYIATACNNISTPLLLDPPGPPTCSAISLPVVYGDILIKNNTLFWTTLTEINSSHFIVQYSTDGATWLDLSRVTSKNVANTVSQYKVNLTSLPIQQGLLRIKQVDFDGKLSFSDLISYENISTTQTEKLEPIYIYPNPSMDEISFVVNADCVVTVFNALGKSVLKTSISAGQNSMSISHLEKGLYILNTSDNQTSRFIKQ